VTVPEKICRRFGVSDALFIVVFRMFHPKSSAVVSGVEDVEFVTSGLRRMYLAVALVPKSALVVALFAGREVSNFLLLAPSPATAVGYQVAVSEFATA
jgi:hypothetical protein